MNSSFGLMYVCLGLIFMLSGCQKEVGPDYASLGLAEVSGTILLDEKPLANANVIFVSADETYSYGRTNANGNYKLMFNSEKSGVMTGEKTVRIQLAGFPEDAEEETGPVDSSELPSSYNKDSQLMVTVVGGVQTVDFDLNSNGSIASTESTIE